MTIRARPSMKGHTSKAVNSMQMLRREERHAEGTAPNLTKMMDAKTSILQRAVQQRIRSMASMSTVRYGRRGTIIRTAMGTRRAPAACKTSSPCKHAFQKRCT